MPEAILDLHRHACFVRPWHPGESDRSISVRPYLKRVWLDPARVGTPKSYPFSLPFLRGGFDLAFDSAITIIVGENGTGKSTLLEAIAALSGYDQAGGGKGYMPTDHTAARSRRPARRSPGRSARRGCRSSPNGWFFRAESFFTVARYLDQAAQEPFGGPPPDFLSHSHGEDFLRFFEERCRRQGLFIFDEPELALSPSRQIEFLKLLRRMEQLRHHPGDHGDACADPDGLSGCAVAAADEGRARSGHASRRRSIFG